MTLIIILLCILLLVLLITWANFSPFIAFLIVSVLSGLLLGIPITSITQSIQKGIGDMLGSIIIIITMGAMLGKLVADSGAAQKITSVMINAFGKKNIQWALVVTGFIIGIPLFYTVGFVLMVPLIFSVVYKYKLPAVYIGLPMLSALSVTHGFLPPHPSPAALVLQFKANMGLTMLYGIIIAIPTIIIAGPLFSQTLKKIPSTPLQTFTTSDIPEDKLPGIANSFISSLLPVILIGASTIWLMGVGENAKLRSYLMFLAEPSIIMILALLIATYTLGIRMGQTMKQLMEKYSFAVKDIVVIILIIAGAGALKEVLTASGVNKEIAAVLQGLNMEPLVLGWLIAAFIRVCIGSATVAGLTAGSLLAPLVVQPGVNANLMVLSIGAGSLMFSHVNDAAFWMFKEYFNVSLKDTIRSWSLMETIVAVAGLVGVLILNLFV
jgi:Gnt-I system high-affinity gluconate transporter